MADEYGDLDVVIQAFGQLGDDSVNVDPVAAAALAEVNYVGAVSSAWRSRAQLRRQGHGTLVVLSSVAGVRTRASNFVYGSTKAGPGCVRPGLGHSLQGSGRKVLVVRPGFVRTKMTRRRRRGAVRRRRRRGRRAVVKGLRRGSSVCGRRRCSRACSGLLRYAPGPIWRKLDR